MGVKSTETLTRTEALNLLDHFRSRIGEEPPMTNEELEDELERLNDIYFQKEYGSGTGFSNYIVRDD